MCDSRKERRGGGRHVCNDGTLVAYWLRGKKGSGWARRVNGTAGFLEWKKWSTRKAEVDIYFEEGLSR